MSKSLKLCRTFLGKEVEVVIDRPIGSYHPQFPLLYEANYGYIAGTIAPDGEEIDAYFLGENLPLKKAKGKCIAILHNLNFDDDKLVVSNKPLTDAEIRNAIKFQDKWGFEYKIVRD